MFWAWCVGRKSINSIEDHKFHALIKEAYFAFEALVQHPFGFVSFMHGRWPEIFCIDGCAKICTDDVSREQFDIARVERDVDANLYNEMLKMSMISKMVFNAHLRWVLEAAPIFGPTPVGSPEDGDAGELMRALGDGAITDLSDKSFGDLKNIYRLCFPDGKGISMYPTKELLAQCLQKLWELADGEGERCLKLFIGKPSGSTAGVEGLFTGDGVMAAHVFQITAESPADAVDMLVHLPVSYCTLSTKTIHVVNRREIPSEHAVFKLHSAMPCVDEMCGKQRGSPPLQLPRRERL
ncbi:unnamed protein product [Ectocarpus sp. CCAP 1310/34]|nr:unnamed protein product [Ectocarpus sp. CCAP 1310/34]